MARKISYIISDAIILSLLLIFFVFLQIKFPLIPYEVTGDGDSMKEILSECKKENFERYIPFEATKSHYIYFRNKSLWRLIVFGEIRGDINFDTMNSFFEKSSKNPPIMDYHFPEKYRQYVASILEKNTSFSSTWSGSLIDIIISLDEKYYILDIRHR